MAMIMKSIVSWNVTFYSMVDCYSFSKCPASIFMIEDKPSVEIIIWRRDDENWGPKMSNRSENNIVKNIWSSKWSIFKGRGNGRYTRSYLV
jgi:hypothetical protein